MWIERTLSKELKKLARTFPAIVLTGPRQTGKTSLFERIFPNYGYVTLDYAQNAEAAESNPEAFLDQNPCPLIIDEIQYAPSLMRHVKTRIDAKRSTMGQFLITGSQSLSLMAEVTETLAGRAAVIPLQTLSFAEMATAYDTGDRAFRNRFLWMGGYPELWANPDMPVSRERWYQSYVTTYLERDVRNLLNVGSLRDFERFLRAVAARVGQVLNISDIGRDVGRPPSTAREWLSVLAASGIVMLLEPYYRSLGKRITKSPKLYFADTGLAAFLCGYSSAKALIESATVGSFWENHVICQWTRWRDWLRPSAALWFWQDQMKNEVDLIVDLDGILTPIEIKWKEKPNERDVAGMKRFVEMYGRENVAKGYVACNTRSKFCVSDIAQAVDGWDVWKLR